jgi:hypothetical protein
MIKDLRKNRFECPVCHYNLCAWEDFKIICLRSNCKWSVFAKRKTDKDIATVAELRKNE